MEKLTKPQTIESDQHNHKSQEYMATRKSKKPPNYPLREIVDSTGSVTKNIDKHIAGIIKTYFKNTDHYIKNKDETRKCD